MAYQPKSYKKFVATAATATLVATAIVPVASAADAKSFKDVSKTYKVAVDYLVANDITQGMTETTFGTTKSITRGDAAIMIAKALKLNTTSAANAGFKDVNKRVAGAVNAVVEAKIASGTSKTTFNPDANITRQEMAKMIANAYNLKAGTTKNEFKDVNNNWDAYVDALLANGITLGKTATTFAATASVTRGEFALFVHRSETLAPAVVVEKVTVVNETTTTVAVKVANKELKASDFKVLVNGVAVSPTKVESDAKGEVYTITHASLKDTKGIVSVNGSQANFDYTAPVVESVKAINAIQVEVKFNQAVDKTTAVDVANYKVNDVLLATHDAGATLALSADAKSVVITFSAHKNKTSFDLTVSGVKNVEKTKTIETSKTVVTVNDTVAPTVSLVEYTSAGKAEITFSEPMDTGVIPIVRVNGTPYTATFVAGSKTKVEVPVTVAKGTTATIYVAGAKDSVGNESTLYNGSFTAPNDTTAPSIVSLKQVGQNQIKVVLSEALASTSGYDLDIADLKLLVGSQVRNSTAVTKDATDASGKTYTVTFTESDIYGTPTPVDSQAVTVILDAGLIKDAYGNGNAAFSQAFTFTADKTGPSLLSGMVSTDKQTLELTFDEAIEPLSTDIDETKIIITDANGVRFSAIDATTIAKTGAGNEKVLLVDFVASTGLIPNGTYTVQLQAGAVKDAKSNLSSAGSVSVIVGSSSDTVKPTAILDGASAVNKFVVDFGEEVTSSALTLANYKLDGAALPTGAVAYFNSAAKDKVTIELPVNSVNIGDKTTGTPALLNVSNVADKAGNIVDPTNLAVKVGDNTPAILTSAQKLGNTLVLTFNEALDSTTATDAAIADVLANYTIKAGSATVVAGTGTGTATAAPVAGDNKKVQITFATTTGTGYDAASTITVTTKAGGDLTDANGVAVKSAVTVTAN